MAATLTLPYYSPGGELRQCTFPGVYALLPPLSDSGELCVQDSAAEKDELPAVPTAKAAVQLSPEDPVPAQ